MAAILTLFNTMTERDKSDSVKKLIEQSSPRQDFFLMIGLSVLMATFGLLSDNTAVIIGSMLIAPLLYPVLGIALGVVISDKKVVWRSIVTVVKSSIIGIGSAAAITWMFFGTPNGMLDLVWFGPNTEMISAAVAVIAGTAASFAMIKPKLNETLPGIAISVALIPPLATVGIGIAWLQWQLVYNAFSVFLLNVLGIVIASGIVFSLMHLHHKKEVVKTAVKEDEIEIKKEESGEINHED